MARGEVGVVATPFTFFVHGLGVIAAVLVLVWCIYFRGGLAFSSSNKSLIFNIHPVLMLIGFVFVASEAILAYRILPGTKEVRKIIHLSLHFIALVLGIVGIYAAFKYHNESGIVNLYSLHSWIGLGTICLFGIQWLIGLVTFFYPGGSQTVKATILPWHVIFGLFVYILALATAELGFLEKLTFLENSGLDKYGSEALLVNFTALVVVFLGAFVILSAVLPTQREPQGYAPIAED
ncbi:hypothetical protein AMTRI_Chr07g30750 [Amborella trichopoda]|uniref:Cytochrome b561 domain-containing protein n=1 Tax=Amborella trichopoda TaxID=13333 RepID=W1NH32_AMBTC|nr:ascorbate-specific transmembrane electron transporter 2 [Amborella trichopoda]ERM95107.1 hypothetical protein AMTR_s00009p00257510 [Amborella trichopoda]|eukprot:XP_006827691.1 ascorbate-specific transmembrane electron transporter 2 [Amborella trichopoda]